MLHFGPNHTRSVRWAVIFPAGTRSNKGQTDRQTDRLSNGSNGPNGPNGFTRIKKAETFQCP